MKHLRFSLKTFAVFVIIASLVLALVASRRENERLAEKLGDAYEDYNVVPIPLDVVKAEFEKQTVTDRQTFQVVSVTYEAERDLYTVSAVRSTDRRQARKTETFQVYNAGLRYHCKVRAAFIDYLFNLTSNGDGHGGTSVMITFDPERDRRKQPEAWDRATLQLVKEYPIDRDSKDRNRLASAAQIVRPLNVTTRSSNPDTLDRQR